MNNNELLDKIKSFGMTNQMVAEDLSAIEKHFDVELGHLPPPAAIVEREYYPQLDAAVRAEAARMARHYEIFYSLEKSIRKLVSDTLSASENNSDWWNGARVPIQIKSEVGQRITKEIDAGVTRRSSDEIDYTTFGELSVIITYNCDIFGGNIFNSKKALEKVIGSLNALRNPIAHCTPLAEDEELRLRLTVRDWFRLMEK